MLQKIFSFQTKFLIQENQRNNHRFKNEKVLEKEQIMELYLNEIYLGNGSYGIASTSLNYFNKSV